MDIEAELKPAPISKSQKIWKTIKEKTKKAKSFVLKAFSKAEVQCGIGIILTIGGLALVCYFSPLAFVIMICVLCGVGVLVS